MLMTMEPAAFIDGMRALITREVVANASITFGESEASVTRGLTAALPMVLGALATKAGNRSLMSRIFDLIQDPAAEDCAPGNVANLVGPRASITLGVSLGNRFVSLLLGNNTESIGRVLSSFAGVRLSTAASMLSLAGPLALGYLGKTVRREGLDVSGLSSRLLAQRNAIMRFIPNAFTSVPGFGPQMADTVVQKTTPWKWVVPLLLALLAIWVLVSILGNRSAAG